MAYTPTNNGTFTTADYTPSKNAEFTSLLEPYTPGYDGVFGEDGYVPSPNAIFASAVDNTGVISAVIEQEIFDTGTVAATIQQDILTFIGQIAATIEQEIYDTGTVAATIEQEIYDTGTVAATIEQTIVDFIGQIAATIEQNIFDTGTVAATIQQDILTFIGQISNTIQVDILSQNELVKAKITQVIFDVGTVTATIEQNIAEQTGVVSASIEQIIYDTAVISAAIQSEIYEITPIIGNQDSWTLTVTLDGVDVSASLTETVWVDREEDAAAAAQFTLKPSVGVVDLPSWNRAPVAIAYTKTDVNALPVFTYTLFSGFVDVPTYNPSTRLTTFSCTDELQKSIEGMSRGQIDGVIGGDWSPNIFNEEADPWSYAQDRLSTQAASVSKTIQGQIVVTPWAVGAIKTTFTESNVLDVSLTADLASTRDLVNESVINFDYRKEIKRQRTVKVTWNMIPTPISLDFFLTPWGIPANELAIAAMEDSGWVIGGTPTFTPLPKSREYNDGGVQRIFLNNFPAGIIGFTSKAQKRYSQTITENHVFEVKAPQSAGDVGSVRDEQQYSMEASFGAGLEDFLTLTSETLTYEVIQSSGQFSVISEQSVSWNEYANDFGGSSDVGDIIFDTDSLIVDGTRAEFETAGEIAQKVAISAILRSHRQNSVGFTIIIDPTITTVDTLRLNTDTVKATGKVRQVRHEFSIEQGSALTTVMLAISRTEGVGGGGGGTPVVPAESEPDTVTDEDSLYINLDNNIGGLQTSPPFSDDFDGFITNAENPASGSNSEGYTTKFAIPFPEVEEANLQEAESEVTTSITVTIPIDELILEA